VADKDVLSLTEENKILLLDPSMKMLMKSSWTSHLGWATQFLMTTTMKMKNSFKEKSWLNLKLWKSKKGSMNNLNYLI